jgi:hypothetical protein
MTITRFEPRLPTFVTDPDYKLVVGILELWDRYPTYQIATALIKAFGLAAPPLHELIRDEALRSPSD